MTKAEFQPKKEVLIEPARGFALGKLLDLWLYRELAFFLALRDIKVRYKQTVLGASWAIIQPLMTMVIFTIIFGTFAKLPSDGVPYPIFTYTAVLPWAFFATALVRVSGSMVSNAGIIGKVYFPRLVIPKAVIFAVFHFRFAASWKNAASFGFDPGHPPSM